MAFVIASLVNSMFCINRTSAIVALLIKSKTLIKELINTTDHEVEEILASMNTTGETEIINTSESEKVNDDHHSSHCLIDRQPH